MTQVVVRVRQESLPQEVFQQIITTGLMFGYQALVLAESVYQMWIDEAVALLIATLRVS
jgi:hypothetical protein